jgi:hypothetical protein
MNIRRCLGAVALTAMASIAAPVSAAGCTDSFNLGSMGPPGVTLIGNDFYAPQQFGDCYNFSLSNSAEAFGLTLEWDWSRTTNINVNSVSLSGTGLPSTVVDSTPDRFSFSNLLAGTYQLIVSGSVSGYSSYGSGPVGYVGLLATSRSSVAAPVPEPETYVMLALGLAMVGWTLKRRAAQQSGR